MGFRQIQEAVQTSCVLNKRTSTIAATQKPRATAQVCDRCKKQCRLAAC